MNKRDIKIFGQEVYCYRIRTARSKKRNVREVLEKQLIRFDKELRQISDKQRSLGYVDLRPPVMKGWKRYFVLREDVARNKQAVFYKGILEKINTTIYSNRKDFQKRKHRRSRNKFVDIEQSLLSPDESHMQKLKFSEKELVLFEERWIRIHGTNQRKKVFVFREPWRFVLRVRPNLITRIKAVSITLEIREKQIEDYMKRNDKWGMLSRLKGISVSKWRSWDNHPKKQYRFEKKNLRQMLMDETTFQ